MRSGDYYMFPEREEDEEEEEAKDKPDKDIMNPIQVNIFTPTLHYPSFYISLFCCSSCTPSILLVLIKLWKREKKTRERSI